MYRTSMLSLFAILARIDFRLVAAGQWFDYGIGTIYYDIYSECWVPGADVKDPNNAAKFNAPNNACGYSANQLGKSRIVAISQSLFYPERCGAEIVLYRNGQPFQFPAGESLFVADICPECPPNQIDIGASAANTFNGGPGCKNLPTGGFSFEITDRIVGPMSGESLDAWRSSGRDNIQGSPAAAGPSQQWSPPAPEPPQNTWSASPSQQSWSAPSSQWSAVSTTIAQTWNQPPQVSSQGSASVPASSSSIISVSAITSAKISASSNITSSGSQSAATSRPALSSGVRPIAANLGVDGNNSSSVANGTSSSNSSNVCRRRLRRRGLPLKSREEL